MAKRIRSTNQRKTLAVRSAPMKRRARPRRKMTRGPPLDPAALAYAHLLNDPCNGPLTHPVYAGGEGGYLARYEKDFILNTGKAHGPTATAGAFIFTPGLLCTGMDNDTIFDHRAKSSTYYASPSEGSTINDSTPCVWRVDTATQPGFDQLTLMAGGGRCVAACMQITYPGAELDRSGVVSLAQIPDAASVLRAGASETDVDLSTFTVGDLRATSPMVSRTPETTLEVKWKPSWGDQKYKTLDTLQHNDSAQHSALVLTFSGLKPGVGVRVRLVAVYEWVPKATKGLMQSNESRTRTPNTLDDVLNYLDNAGNWVYGSMQFARKAYKAYQTLLGPFTRAPNLEYAHVEF